MVSEPAFIDTVACGLGVRTWGAWRVLACYGAWDVKWPDIGCKVTWFKREHSWLLFA